MDTVRTAGEKRPAKQPARMPVTTLEFETPQFLHSLTGGDITRWKQLERETGVRITTRDGWLRLEGPEESIARAHSVIAQLEDARRNGSEIDARLFRFAIDAVVKTGHDAPALKELTAVRMLGTARKPPVVPKTPRQLEYLRAIEQHDVTFGIGPAGTGKTYLAVASALHALKTKLVGRIVLARPAVEAGEALGFLPGDLNEKIFPYLRPLYDALYDMVDPEELEKMIDRGQIEIAPLAYMRGRTLGHSFIILDEAQNTSRAQMLMFLTRLGEGSKCVVTGDPSQIDLRDPNASGLIEAMAVLSEAESVCFVNFQGADAVRHPVVQRIIEAYARAREKEK
jgi:phosphate starvation-inducible PhoH-like protein